MIKPTQQRRPGWTLIELVVVLAIIGVLISLILVAVVQVREASNRTRCLNNLHQLGLAAHGYSSVNGTMPPYASGLNGTPYGSWGCHLLPHLDAEAVYRMVANTKDPTVT